MSTHYIPSDSLENISILDENITPLEIFKLPQPCLLNGADISYVSSLDQIKKFSSLEIANKMLTTLIGVENKLQSSFSPKNLESKGKQDFSDIETGFSHIKEQNEVSTRISSLPFIHLESVPSHNSFVLKSDLLQLLSGVHQIDSSTIIFSQLKHPLEDKIAFNNFISRLCHISISVQNILKIQQKQSILIPIPNNPLIITSDGKKTYLNETIITPLLFFQEILDIAKKASVLTNFPCNVNLDLKQVSEVLQAKSIKQVNFSLWNNLNHEMQKLTHFFLTIIKKYSQEQLMKLSSSN